MKYLATVYGASQEFIFGEYFNNLKQAMSAVKKAAGKGNYALAKITEVDKFGNTIKDGFEWENFS